MTIDKAKKKGRPPFPYSDNLADEICEAIASSSKGLDPLCKDNPHWPSRETIYQWLANNTAFSDKYARAKTRQAAQESPHIKCSKKDQPRLAGLPIIH